LNQYGQLGNGNNINGSLPVQVIGLNSTTAISTKIFHTVAYAGDSNFLGSVTTVLTQNVQVITGANVNISVVLQGGSSPDSGWVVPLTVKLFTPRTIIPVDVLTADPVCTFNLTTAKSGNTAVVQATGVIPSAYDISVTSEHCLCNVKRSVVIGSSSVNFNMGTLLEGDANVSCVINIQDFGILASTYGKAAGASGYDDRPDFDRNGIINIADFGLLAANYGKYCPVEVP
jgi:hypothetical protein